MIPAVGQSFAHFLRNSETLRPAALAFSESLRYSALDTLDLTVLERRSVLGFGGLPIRFFTQHPHDTLCGYNKSRT